MSLLVRKTRLCPEMCLNTVILVGRIGNQSKGEAMETEQNDQTRLAIAALAASFVHAFEGADEGFHERFIGAMDKTYNALHNVGFDTVAVQKTLNWTREFMKQLNPREL